MGMYTILSMLFLFLVAREIEHGPEPTDGPLLERIQIPVEVR